MIRRLWPLAFLVLACADDGSGTGSEGGPCRPDNTCEPGLACLAGTCVKDPDSGQQDLPPPWPDGWKPTDTVSPDSPPPVDGPQPKPDTGPKPDKGPKPDLGPKPDKGPTSCLQWSSWSCTKNPRYGVLCWATCSGAKGAIWCDGGGNCYCSGAGPGNCASGVPINLSQPCDGCKTALEQHGCCLP